MSNLDDLCLSPSPAVEAPPARILILDEDDTIQSVLRATLRDPGAILVQARSVPEALAALLKDDFALALLHVRTPDSDGMAGARLIRQESQLKEIPIIVISALPPQAEVLARAYELGFVEFMVKPLNTASLQGRVRIFLELFRSRTDLAQHVAKRTIELEKEVSERRRRESQMAQELKAVVRLKAVGDLCARPGTDFRQCLEEILGVAIELAGAEKGNLQLLDPETNTLLMVVHRGFEPEFVRYFGRVDVAGSTSCACALREARRIIFEDLQATPLAGAPEPFQIITRARVRSVQSTPLISSAGKVLGIFSTYFSRPHTFETRDLGWLDLLARQAADFIERKRAEEHLRASEERERARAAELEAVMESVPAAILISKDREARVIVGNPSSYEILRMTRGQNVSKSSPDAPFSSSYDVRIDGKPVRPDELPIQRTAATGLPITGSEVEIAFRDGTSRWLYGNTVPLLDKEGKVKQVVAAFVDISERRLAQEALSQSQERHRFLAEVGAIMGTSLDYYEQLASLARLAVSRIADASFFYLLDEAGYPRRVAMAHVNPERSAQAAGLADDFPLPAEAPCGHRMVLQTGKGRLLSNITEEMIEAAVGSPEALSALRRLRPRSCLCVPLRVRDKLLGALTLMTDVSSRTFGPEDLAFAQQFADRAAVAIDNALLFQSILSFNKILEVRVEERTAKLKDALTDLEGFSYTVAHDLRAPLRALAGLSGILMEDYGGKLDPMGREYLDRIINAARQMDRLVQDLLSFSKVGRGEIELEPVDLELLLAELLSQLENEITRRRAQIHLRRPFPSVQAHRVLLSQVLSNLIGNAIKFVSPDVLPKVEIEAELRDERVRISIKDNGIGIDAQHHSMIFEIFQRLNPERFPGTGVGLAIVKKAAARMGGTSGVESRPGNGSCFWIDLGRAAGQDPSQLPE